MLTFGFWLKFKLILMSLFDNANSKHSSDWKTRYICTYDLRYIFTIFFIYLCLFPSQSQLLLPLDLGHQMLISLVCFTRMTFIAVYILHPTNTCLSQQAQLLTQAFIKHLLMPNQVRKVRHTITAVTLKHTNVFFLKCNIDFCVFSANIPWDWLRHYSDCEFNVKILMSKFWHNMKQSLTVTKI